MDYIEIDGHKLHLFRTGDEIKPKLVFMSGSGTVSPVYDFKILYEKLVSDFRIIVIEKFGYGCSDLYEGPCDVDSVVAYQRIALENAGEKGPYILLPHSMSGLEAIRWKQNIRMRSAQSSAWIWLSPPPILHGAANSLNSGCAS